MLTFLPIRRLSTSTFYHKMMIVMVMWALENESNSRHLELLINLRKKERIRSKS